LPRRLFDPVREGTCQMRACRSPDTIAVRFDDENLVADAGLILVATLAEGLGLRGAGGHPHRPGQRAGRGERERQGDDPCPLGVGRWPVDQRRRSAAGRVNRPGARTPGRRVQHAGDVPALVHLGQRPAAGPGRRDRAGSRLGGRGRSRTVAADHRPGLDPLRDLRITQTGRGCGRPGWDPRRPSAVATAAGTGDVLHSRLREGWPIPGEGRPASWPRRSTGRAGLRRPGRSRCGPTPASTTTRWSRRCSRPGRAARSPSGSTRPCAGSSRRSPTTPGRRSAIGWTAAPTWRRPAIGRWAARDGCCG